jgi:hypothetical protein
VAFSHFKEGLLERQDMAWRTHPLSSIDPKDPQRVFLIDDGVPRE